VGDPVFERGGLRGPISTSDTLTGIVNAFSDAASNLDGTLLPTADIVNALITTLPAEDASIFAYELGQNNLLDAVGLPIAAEVRLGSLLGMFEVGAVGEGSCLPPSMSSAHSSTCLA
jgi:hypothetical protein